MTGWLVKEVFATLQGEGTWAGTPAVFVRFGGCNLWSGHDADRERDASRHGADCPRWCDTDFVTATSRYSTVELLNAVFAEAAKVGMGQPQHVVFTGGEPLLQLQDPACHDLVHRLIDMRCRVQIETNGTRPVPESLVDTFAAAAWITVAPKTAPDTILALDANELKVPFPNAWHPDEYAVRMMSKRALRAHGRLFVQPIARTSSRGVSVLDEDTTKRAIDFCLRHPDWRLSVQTHKTIGVP